MGANIQISFQQWLGGEDMTYKHRCLLEGSGDMPPLPKKIYNLSDSILTKIRVNEEALQFVINSVSSIMTF